MDYVPDEALTLDLIPTPDASWHEIQEFALAFSGYSFHGSSEKCAEIANARRHETLSDLRTCLFFEQRRWHHFGRDPHDEAMVYIRSLVDGIRARVVQTMRQRQMDMAAYRERLIARYWAYQKDFFCVTQDHFDRPFAPDASPRPPVFRKDKESENVIMRPGATEEETRTLLRLVPEGEKHKWFRSMNSSQALTQSILGNLALSGDLVSLTELVDDDGMALFGKAHVLTENFRMEYKVDYLGEPRPTSIDGYIGGEYRVAIECKLTEAEVGTCSRPRLTPKDSNYERDYCNGKYTRQRARQERCSLTQIGVRYWRYVPSLLRLNSERDIDPCPLDANYQLVRNILAIGVTPEGQVSPAHGHVIMIYDERNPAFQKGGKGFTAFTVTRQALLEPAMLRKCSWQRIVEHMRRESILPWLTEQLELKYGL
jgi:hypothetical protein